MEVFVKSFATYRTIKKATSISCSVVLDSLDMETSTVTVKGTSINRSDAGNWLIIDGSVYQISDVKPESDQATLTLRHPLDAFSRSLELYAQTVGQTIGGFVSQQLQRSWITEDDPLYAMPYLVVSTSDTTAFVVPELDNSGCFKLPDYCRLMRKSYRVVVRFFDGGSTLQCRISKEPVVLKNVPFDDGHSNLQSVAYSASGIAKLTVIHDVDTGEKDSDGNKVYTRERTVWYLSESGEISQLIPARRAAGEWGTLYIQGDKNVEEKVIETFAKNKANHKLEFWSELDLDVNTDCTFMVYGELLHSHISYKRKSSEDKRFYYKSGELATTATEKLRGVLK